ncbi:MAG: hypothetical protein ACK4NR_01210 [Micavibrio sp.]
MTDLIYQWIDLLWVPVALVAVHKGQRLKTVVFLLVCILTMRAQVELMEHIGKPSGFTGLLETEAYERGLITYGIIFALFLLLAYLSPHTKGIVFFAATISLYVLSFCFSMLVMVI